MNWHLFIGLYMNYLRLLFYCVFIYVIKSIFYLNLHRIWFSITSNYRKWNEKGIQLESGTIPVAVSSKTTFWTTYATVRCMRMGRPQKAEQVRRPAIAINLSHCFREKEHVNENVIITILRLVYHKGYFVSYCVIFFCSLFALHELNLFSFYLKEHEKNIFNGFCIAFIHEFCDSS